MQERQNESPDLADVVGTEYRACMPETPVFSTARRNLAVLVIAQGYLGAQMPMMFIVSALAGQSLAPNACLATLPISLIVLGSMLAATPLSNIMQRHGRTLGFVIGSTGGAVGAALSAWGLATGSFVLFLIGSAFAGMYLSSQGFFRFAAADTASEAFRPKAISYVIAAGLASAVTGPQLVKVTADASAVPFLGTFLAIIVINVSGAFLFLLLDIPKPKAVEVSENARTRLELLKSPKVLVAIICAMVSYSLMNLVMTSTPLAVVGCGFSKNNAADIVSAHVLAMFAPSFFTGHLIARFGAERIVAIGLAILAGAGGVALSGTDLSNFFGALILLGFGWNFGFIGATAMLSNAHSPEERGRVQGLNDTIVFGCVTLASLSSGGLMNCTGGSPVEGWTFVNFAMAPFLALAGGALLWLTLARRTPGQAAN